MKKGIIITSFGTTYEETRKLCIEPIEDMVRENFKDFLVLRAFTSRIVAKRLKDRGYPVDNPTEALEKMKEEGIKDIYIQPLLIIPGHEYEKIKNEVEKFLEKNQGYKIKIGRPLLGEEKDYEKVVNSLNLKGYNDSKALVFMGHGSDHIADESYARLESKFKELGWDNIFIGTVEGSIGIGDILEKIKEFNIGDVELRPFMLVAGDHATNDMASDEEDSWKSILKKEGLKVTTNISGLGEVVGIRKLFLSHLEDIL